MHRATPANSSFRAYVAGGARVTVPDVDDTKLMQESKGNFMANEKREKIESPQNYGFTSVVRDAIKDAQGKIQQSAETFVSFMGGNRSFPVFGNMDDRRFRLKELQKGDVAMFDYLQHQFHLNTDGMFMTGRTDKKLKLQLVDPPQDNQSGSASPSARDATSGGSGGGQSSSAMGQKKRYDQSTKQYVEVTKDTTNLVHDQTIQHKTGVHSFQPPEGGASAKSGGALVQIFGDKFTGGLGYFMKQVTAAPPTSSMHLTTQGYVQSIINGLGFSMPSIPSLPMPPLPPGITLPPGVTLPPLDAPERQTSAPTTTWVGELMSRLEAMEARLTKIEEILQIK
jgi:phage gp45-like